MLAVRFIDSDHCRLAAIGRYILTLVIAGCGHMRLLLGRMLHMFFVHSGAFGRRWPGLDTTLAIETAMVDYGIVHDGIVDIGSVDHGHIDTAHSCIVPE